MRGEHGEFNSWQYPMGQGTPKVLEAMGVLVTSVDKAEEVKTVVDHAARLRVDTGFSTVRSTLAPMLRKSWMTCASRSPDARASPAR